MDTLSALLHRTEATLDVDLSQGSISSLLNSSSFEIISNPELRTLLLQWNDLVSNYKQAESLLIQFTVDKYFPYLDEQIPMPHFEGVKDGRSDLAFIRSVKFENMIKRRKSLIDNMDFIMFRLDDSKIINALDRIIELSADRSNIDSYRSVLN